MILLQMSLLNML